MARITMRTAQKETFEKFLNFTFQQSQRKVQKTRLYQLTNSPSKLQKAEVT